MAALGAVVSVTLSAQAPQQSAAKAVKPVVAHAKPVPGSTPAEQTALVKQY
ncbi:MAG: hypothetical protein RLZZ53_2808, partial [Acidobacteriota bacterium]